jgi:excinuclease UvrABC ATPase subunit
MTIFCVGGVSGSGKSTLINQHHVLEHLPCWDIATYYREAEEQGIQIDWQQAFAALWDDVDDYLLHNPYNDVVLEAFFRPGGDQREM